MDLLTVLVNKTPLDPPPRWMMRQAGRYLPEYRAVRQRHSDFIAFCFTPADVVTVTCQPLNRFPLSAAIIFSDILVIPHLLGQRVWFEQNHGPRLERIDFNDFLKTAPTVDFEKMLSPVADAIQQTREHLDSSKALIGFSGAPWTLLTYMVSQGKTHDFSCVVSFAKANPELFKALQTVLESYVIRLLLVHLKAGVNAVQLFESWALEVPSIYRDEWLYQPLRRIVQGVRHHVPHAPFIYYGRGISDDYIHLSDLDIAFGIDENGDLLKVRNQLPVTCVTQGNLSPQKLIQGASEEDIYTILAAVHGKPHIFNLGHGINKNTPILHVEKMIEIIKKEF
jgi:uroporphyrinogen decarboxylase